MTSKTARLCVIVATLGRPSEVADLLRHLAGQTRAADRIILSATSAADLPPDTAPAEVVFGPKGSCAQRNTALDHLTDGADVVVFMDDDYIPSRHALEHLETFFQDHPDIVGCNGLLIRDGINSRGIAYEDAVALVDAYDAQPSPDGCVLSELSGLYGCNMAFRGAAIATVRFDEALPLYGWQEDIDFAARLRPLGRLVKTDAWAGVHRGIKTGRTSGLKFGYSQIANPIYLVNKGTMRPGEAYALLLRNLIANHVRAFWPEPWVDRLGRLRGNWRALADLARGRLRPQAILDL